jgi:hypothetical protein
MRVPEKQYITSYHRGKLLIIETMPMSTKETMPIYRNGSEIEERKL